MSLIDYDVIIRSVLVVVSAMLGVLTTFAIKVNHKKLCSLISFSAGALMGAALFAILPETHEELSLIEIIISATTGYILFWAISKYFAHVCPACSASHFDEQTTKKFSDIVMMMIIALSIHSFFDGVALVSDKSHNHMEGNSIFLAVLVHKFPEGLALASLMLGAAYKKKKIFYNVLFVEMTTIAGAVVGSLLINFNVSIHLMSILMAHIAGGFVFLAIHAVQGEMLKNHKLLVLSSFLIGIMIIFSTHYFSSSL